MKRVVLVTLLLIGAGCGRRDPNTPEWRLTSYQNIRYQTVEQTTTGVEGIREDGKPFRVEGRVLRSVVHGQSVVSIRGYYNDNPATGPRIKTEIVITRR
jgi:hypothetical protein